MTEFQVTICNLQNKQCDQSLKSEIRPIFAKNSHIYSPDFQPPFFPAPFSALINE